MELWSCCACCGAFHPRYRRLVDNIYPPIPDQGLLKGNMQKLTFYAISHPEKLDRIGEYLAYRLSRDVYRQRTASVRISVEAMDQLLAACHGSPSLSLFVESFLKMVQKLLETQQSELEVMATDSFVKFANIEEDTPSYHRRYDFFISKFSAMCHSAHPTPNIRRQLRLGGINGLRGVIRKTVSDELQANIWERQHMEKIVPSLLFNMHDSPTDETDGPRAPQTDEEQPRSLADVCLRELVGKASFGNMKCVLQPVLRHLDLHDLWRSPFAIWCFEAIMYSIQTQYSHVVMQALISHLDMHASDRSWTRVGIATVLSRVANIAVAANIGPSVYDIFNSVLRHLRQSVELQYSSREAVDGAVASKIDDTAERGYQETLITTMGDFANNVPDYLKVEIMMFTIGKVPLVTDRRSDTFLQHVLMRTLLKVATKYKTNNLSVVFTNTFLEPLLQLALVDDAGVRLLAQKMLHTLLDRHGNAAVLENLGFVHDVMELNLTVEKCSRTDAIVMKKTGYPILSTLYKSALASSNTGENFAAILCTMALLCVEVGCEDVLVDLFRLSLAFQNAASDPDSAGLTLSYAHRAALHNLVAKYINLAAQLMAVPTLCQHVQQVMKNRASAGVSQELNLAYRSRASSENLNVANARDSIGSIASSDIGSLEDESIRFEKQMVAEALSSRNYDVTRLLNLPFVPRPTGDGLAGKTVVDAGSVSVDIPSIESSSSNSRRFSRRNTLFAAYGLTAATNSDGKPIPLTVESLKQIVGQPVEHWTKMEDERARTTAEKFSSTPFETLLVEQRDYACDISESVSRIMQKVKEKETLLRGGDSPSARRKPKNVFELQFPELFVY